MLTALRRWIWGRDDDGQRQPWLISSFTSRKYAELVDSLLHRSLPSIGEYLQSSLPAPVAQQTWPDVEADLHAIMRRKMGVAESDQLVWLRYMRVRRWASAPSPYRHPISWARARMLYAVNPADDDPHSYVVFAMTLLQCSVAYQISNWTNLLLLALIDKHDEFQLITWIITNRGFHFVAYGLIQLVQNANAYFVCVLSDVGDRHPCSSNAPGREENYEIEFFMELLRVTTVWIAVAHLYSRGCKGGKAHVVELERRRLGLSLRHTGLLNAAIGGAEDLTDASPTEPKVLSKGSLAKVTPLARPPRRAGLLRYLFVYDAGAWAFCYSCGFLNLWLQVRQVDCGVVNCHLFNHDQENDRISWVWPDSWHWATEDWRLWMTLDFAQTTYSLMLLPYFLLLLIRPLRAYVTLAKPTGYDRAGQLQAALTAADKKLRAELDPVDGSEAAAATRIQAIRRGVQARQQVAISSPPCAQSSHGHAGGARTRSVSLL